MDLACFMFGNVAQPTNLGARSDSIVSHYEIRARSCERTFRNGPEAFDTKRRTCEFDK